MGRKAAPEPLALSDTSDSLGPDDPPIAETASQGASPADSRSPKSPRSSPFHSRFSPLRVQERKLQRPETQHKKHEPSQQLQPRDEFRRQAQPVAKTVPEHGPSTTTYPPISSAFEPTPGPSSKRPQTAHTEGRRTTKNPFFHFNKASKSSNQYQPHVHQQQQRKQQQPQQQQPSYTESRSQLMSRGSDGANYGDPSQSEPSLASLQKPISADPSRSDLSVSSAGDYEGASPHSSSSRKNKPKPFGILNRKTSDRDREGASLKETPTTSQPTGNEPELYLNSLPLRTAPVAQDRSFRDMMSSAVRNRSEDRAPVRDASATRDGHRERESKTQPSSLRENGGSNFLSGLRNSSTRAADMFSKNFFGKGSRSGSTNEREPVIDDESYQVKVLNLPLIEQTRLTRISKRLEDSRDKTEFWMPAFPWRAIDFLNYKGCDVEGLYRVPGSGPQIKKWQRRFDEKGDVNLFEENDLYDINIIGSMLKAWLRELPDELFPKSAQDRVSRECAGAEEVPQMLIDELSNLSPFNYYLLFAITCHLSLLLAHSDKNKMDFRNLCICFQPCMKIDAFCFRFLVCNWRDCWKGCKNENRYIEEEYLLFDQPPPRGLAEPQRPLRHESAPQESAAQDIAQPSRQEPPPPESDLDRQQLSSSGSSKQSAVSPVDQTLRPRRKPLQVSVSNGSVASNHSSISTTLTINSDRDATRGSGSGDLRPLSPIKPLSPLGF